MSYIRRFSRWNNSSFQVSIYPHSKTKEELGKITIFEGFIEWYVNPSISCPEDWDVQITTYGKAKSFDDARLKIESFIK